MSYCPKIINLTFKREFTHANSIQPDDRLVSETRERGCLQGENTLVCSDIYNLAQKLDNSVEIVKITGHE